MVCRGLNSIWDSVTIIDYVTLWDKRAMEYVNMVYGGDTILCSPHILNDKKKSFTHELHSSNCRPGVLGVTEPSCHLTLTPWGAILQICFISDLYKLTRSLPENDPCYWMWLMLGETQRMYDRVTSKGGRVRKLIFIAPEKLLMMRDTRYRALTRDGHQVTCLMGHTHVTRAR